MLHRCDQNLLQRKNNPQKLKITPMYKATNPDPAALTNTIQTWNRN